MPLKLKKAGDHALCGVSGNCKKRVKRWNGWEETVSLSWWSFWYFSSFAPRYWFLIAPIFPMLQLMDQSVWLVFSDQHAIPTIYYPTMLYNTIPCPYHTRRPSHLSTIQPCCAVTRPPWSFVAGRPLRWWCTLMLNSDAVHCGLCVDDVHWCCSCTLLECQVRCIDGQL